MKVLGLIPARYDSSRFPGKPLAMIGGRSMIRRVYEQAMKSNTLEDVYVATDDDRIHSHVLSFSGKSILTSKSHRSGTDRCFEAMINIKESYGISYDIVVNIQGDEPFFEPSQIEEVIKGFEDENIHISTLAKKITDRDDITDPNVVKVVRNINGRALYFSRAAIPFLRDLGSANPDYYKHIGIYAYRSDILEEIVKLPQSSLEIAESLEQLRWLQNDYSIHIQPTEFDSHSVDIPSDLLKFTNKT